MKSKTLFSLVVLTLFTSLIPAMHAQTFSEIYSFKGGADNGGPEAGVTIRGNALYGATKSDWACTVYQLTNTGSDWLFSTIADLPSNCLPLARVVFGPDDHLYGTSNWGGAFNGGDVFKLTPPAGPCRNAACYWAVSDLHDFLLDSKTDGDHPGAGDLIWDQQGNIYGTTQQGGSGAFNCQNLGCGTVYELTPSGNGYTESVLYRFSGPDGAYPNGLVFDNNGNLFGTAGGGGANDDGAIFELTYVVGVGWTEHVLYSFQNATDGIYGRYLIPPAIFMARPPGPAAPAAEPFSNCRPQAIAGYSQLSTPSLPETILKRAWFLAQTVLFTALSLMPLPREGAFSS